MDEQIAGRGTPDVHPAGFLKTVLEPVSTERSKADTQNSAERGEADECEDWLVLACLHRAPSVSLNDDLFQSAYILSPTHFLTSVLQQTRLILRCQWLSFRAVMTEALQRSKLMIAVISLFLLGYQVLGCLFFSKGLGFVSKIPVMGGILQERILYLIFFLFFFMLIFSNAVLLFVGAFRNRQSSWLLALPIRPQAIFAGRVAESIGYSSWGLLVLSAPILISYGLLHDADPLFYLKSILLILTFIALPAALAGIIVLAVARWWPAGKAGTLTVLAIFAGLILWKAVQIVPPDLLGTDIASAELAIRDTLRHTEIAQHPMVPSAWVSRTLLGWLGVHTLGGETFGSMLMLSHSLMALLVVEVVAGAVYLPAWSRLARRSSRRTESLQLSSRKYLIQPGAFRRYLAILRKDLITFSRDPSQWIQTSIVVGLLVVYTLNIQKMGYDYDNPFWHTVICFLNFTVCSLALSTLTTRFVYPEFSLEGQRLWIIGLAPFPTSRILWIKFTKAVIATAMVTAFLMVLSGRALELPASGVVYFTSSMLLLCIGLNALSAGLGTLFPNFRENNPAKMVSGFGGTLCLVASFLLIVVVVLLIALPDILILKSLGGMALAKGKLPSAPVPEATIGFTRPMALMATAAITVPLSLTVLSLAARKIKRLDFLRLP